MNKVKPTAAVLLPVLNAMGVSASAATYCMDYLIGAKTPTAEVTHTKEEEKARLITLTEAGKRLGYSRTTIWRLVKAGTLPVVNPTGSGNNRVRLSDVIAIANGKEA